MNDIAFGHYVAKVPAGWQVWTSVVGTEPTTSALYYLSNTSLAVQDCPLEDQLTADLDSCPPPLASLPVRGVVITVGPPVSYGPIGQTAPLILWGAPSEWCRSVGGEETATGPIATWDAVDVCLRGPDLPLVEALTRAILQTLRYTS